MFQKSIKTNHIKVFFSVLGLTWGQSPRRSWHVVTKSLQILAFRGQSLYYNYYVSISVQFFGFIDDEIAYLTGILLVAGHELDSGI